MMPRVSVAETTHEAKADRTRRDVVILLGGERRSRHARRERIGDAALVGQIVDDQRDLRQPADARIGDAELQVDLVIVEHLVCAERRHGFADIGVGRSEEHTSELQSLMRISYAVFCLKKKKRKPIQSTTVEY